MFIALIMPAARAQLVPPEDVRPDVDGWVVLADGMRIEGLFRSVDTVASELRLLIIDGDGHKHKIFWSQISEMAQRIDMARQMQSTAEHLAAHGVTHQVWHRISVPESNDTELLPLLDPGLDTYLQVYPDPLASLRAGRQATLSQSVVRSETRSAMSGMEALGAGSFLVLPRGEKEPLVVVRGNYAILWEKLFSGCRSYEKPQNPRFEQFERELLAQIERCPAP